MTRLHATDAQLRAWQKALADQGQELPPDPPAKPTKPAKAQKPRQRVMLLSESVWGHTLFGSFLHHWRPYSDGERFRAKCGRETHIPGWMPIYDPAMPKCPECAKGESDE